MDQFPIQVQRFRCLPGASAGLPQKTALLTCVVQGDLQAWHQGCKPEMADWQALLPLQYAEWCHRQPGGVSEWLMTLIIAIQREARDAVWQARLCRSRPEAFTLALPYERQAVIQAALQWAVRHLALWGNPAAAPQQRSALTTAYRTWLEQVQAAGLSPSSLRFALAGFARQWPVMVDAGIVHIGWGVNQKKLDGSFTDRTSLLASRTARIKSLAGGMLSKAGLPVPETVRVASWPQALHAAARLGWPLVVKPENQDQGLGVMTEIADQQALQQAFEAAAAYSPRAVLVQRHVSGNDYRLLVVQGQVLMATCRLSGGVVGDGQHTIAALVDQINRDPRRGRDKRSLLMRLDLDDEAMACLAQQSMTSESVPVSGQTVRLRRTANISRGGTAVDVSNCVHPDNALLAIRAARVIGLDLAGVDLICPDISRSWLEVGGAICEVNAQPGFRPHWLAAPERDINGEILELMVQGQSPRIPTVAITGTNGKSTTARMLHHIWLTAGKLAGVCTTQGVWIGPDQISAQNLSGLPGARMILRDPAIEVGIFEMPRKGMIYFGHPCDRYDVSVLLNVQDDHLGQAGISDLRQMALLKSQVLQRSAHAAVLNADDQLCLSMEHRIAANRLLLVSQSADNSRIRAHCQAGGEAVFLRVDGCTRSIVLSRGAEEVVLMPCEAIAASMGGLLRFNESNAMFAAAAAWAHGVPGGTIRHALETFGHSMQANPGRYNFVQHRPFALLVDYAHNPDGIVELCRVVTQYRHSSGLTGPCHLVSVAIGNSHRHHIPAVSAHLAEAFDSFVLTNDADEVSDSLDYQSERPAQEMLDCFRDALIGQGVPAPAITCLPAAREDWHPVLHEAVRLGLERAQPGDMLVILADPYFARKALRVCGLTF